MQSIKLVNTLFKRGNEGRRVLEITVIFHFLIFKNFNWRLITLQYCGGLCHTFTWISHGYTCVPHPDPPSHLPSHPIPQGHPSAPALSTLPHASNLDWRSISHMINTCFNAILSNHPTLTFSHRVQKSVFYICVSFALIHGVIITIFLNSIYMR